MCEWRIFFDCTPSFLCHSLLWSSSTPFPFPSDVLTQWLYGDVLCDDIMNNRSKIWKSLAIYYSIYYFRLCFSFSCSGYYLSLTKKRNTLNCYSFLHKFLLKTKITNSLLITVITAKTTNSEKTIYFLSLTSSSINKLKSHLLFTCKNFMLSDFMRKKIFAPGNSGGSWRPSPCPSFSTVLKSPIYWLRYCLRHIRQHWNVVICRKCFAIVKIPNNFFLNFIYSFISILLFFIFFYWCTMWIFVFSCSKKNLKIMHDENMQQIYRRTPIQKLKKQLCWNRFLALGFSWKFAAYFQNTFS